MTILKNNATIYDGEKLFEERFGVMANKRFPRLLGNRETALRLSEAILSGSLPHALLLVGPKGSGKHTLAYEIAAMANCENKDGDYPLPCGVCPSCKRIYARNFPDVSYLERAHGKATIGVEELRDFREDMFLSSTESEFKFYIIEDGDLLTPAAQNALLKVLEEPPKNVHIIMLVSEADKLLSTIKSRTQYVQLELFDYDELFEHVTSLSSTAYELSMTSPDRLKEILLSSLGVIGNALQMLDTAKMEALSAKREIIDGFISAIHKKTPFSKIYAEVMALPTKRDELKSVFEGIRNALRDLIATHVADGIAPTYYLTKNQAEEIAAAINLKRLIRVYDIIGSAIDDLDKNAVTASLLTDVAVKLKT